MTAHAALLLISLSAVGQTVTSGDSLEIIADANGNITSLKDGATAMTLRAGLNGGFYLHDFGAAQTNELTNGDFETGDFTGWSNFNGAILTEGANEYVRVTNSGTYSAILQAATLTPGHSYAITADVRTGPSGTITLNVIRTGPTSWWISNATDVQASAQFQLVNEPDLPPAGLDNNLTVWTPVRSSVTIPEGNTGLNLEMRMFSAGWFEIDNVVVEDLGVTGTRLTQTATDNPTSISYSGSGQNTTFTATLQEQTNRIDVTASLTNTSGADRALAFDFLLPLNPTSLTWGDTLDDERAFVAGKRFIYFRDRNTVGDHTTLQLQANPACSVNDGFVGLSIAQDIGSPRVFKMFLDDDGLWIRYHVGLVANSKVPWNATFAFSIYKHDNPTKSLREAMRKYVAVYPNVFINRAGTHGAAGFGVPDTLTGPNDFGLASDFAGFNQATAGRKALQDTGVELLVHPMGSEWHLGQTTTDPKLTASQKHDLLDVTKTGMDLSHRYTWPTTGVTYTHRYDSELGDYETERQRLVNSAMFDLTGEWINFGNLLFAFGDTLGTNPDPDVPTPNMQEGEDAFWIDRYKANAESVGGVHDGVDFDNESLNAGRGFWSTRAAHFAYADSPVCFHAITKQMVLYNAFSNFEYVEATSIVEHGRTPFALCQGNTGSEETNSLIYAPVNDQLGGETNHAGLSRRERARGRRMMSYQKGVNEIANSAGAEAAIDDILAVSMLYGNWPAINGVNYVNADFSPTDRTTCLAYTTDLRTIDTAGWEYLPWVTSADPALIVERFGNFADADLHFSVHNTSGSEVTTTLTIDKVGLSISTKTDWTEIWPGSASLATDVHTTVSVTIPANRTETYSVTRVPEVGTTRGVFLPF